MLRKILDLSRIIVEFSLSQRLCFLGAYTIYVQLEDYSVFELKLSNYYAEWG